MQRPEFIAQHKMYGLCSFHTLFILAISSVAKIFGSLFFSSFYSSGRVGFFLFFFPFPFIWLGSRVRCDSINKIPNISYICHENKEIYSQIQKAILHLAVDARKHIYTHTHRNIHFSSHSDLFRGVMLF